MKWLFPDNTKSSIQYTVDGNVIEIAGTNELADLPISLQCWPKKGWHAGVYKEAVRLFEKVRIELSNYDLVLVKGYSMGGAIAQVLAYMLQEEGKAVYCNVWGSFPVSVRKQAIPGVVRIYGNDPVPALFPWFKQCVKKQYEGPKRWLPFVLKDHVKY